MTTQIQCANALAEELSRNLTASIGVEITGVQVLELAAAEGFDFTRDLVDVQSEEMTPDEKSFIVATMNKLVMPVVTTSPKAAITTGSSTPPMPAALAEGLARMKKAMKEAKPPVQDRFDADNNPITREEWTKLKTDPDYVLLREFANDDFRVTLTWVGQGKVSDFPKYRQNVVMTVFNRSGANWVPDPDVKWFPDKAKGLKAYDAYLVDWNVAEKCTDMNGQEYMMEKENKVVQRREKFLHDNSENKPDGIADGTNLALW